METKEAVTVLAALAQTSRLAVFRLLIQAGPQGMPATHIADALDIAPSSLSFHLKELHHAGIVSQTRVSRSLWYAVNFATVNGLLAFLTEDCCGGNPWSPGQIPACASAEAVEGATSAGATANTEGGKPRRAGAARHPNSRPREKRKVTS